MKKVAIQFTVSSWTNESKMLGDIITARNRYGDHPEIFLEEVNKIFARESGNFLYLTAITTDRSAVDLLGKTFQLEVEE